ncbi:MAG: glycosyltransferase family 1 protein [Terracidiphilus sp.]|jgi:glycosyltransferase involved in cell wall biosynthesis
MNELVIDVRKMFDAGIGTYIRNVIPRVVHQLQNHRLALLVADNLVDWQKECLNRFGDVRWIVAKAKPFTLREQLEIRQLVGPAQVFWATSLAHSLFSRSPLIATVHDVAQLALGDEGGRRTVKAAARLYFQSLRKRAALLMMISGFTRDEFARYVGTAPGAEIVVTPAGVDPSWFLASSYARLKALPNRYFLVVGNLRPHKNLRRVLRAYCGVMNTVPQHLVIVGRHEGFRTSDLGIVELIRMLGPKIHFLGALDDIELKASVAYADALIFASLYEGFGLPVLEAAAAGCIVVTSQTGAAREICGDAAFFIDPESTDSIQASMMRVAELESGEREARVKQGMARARAFSWDLTAATTADAIEKVCFINRP